MRVVSSLLIVLTTSQLFVVSSFWFIIQASIFCTVVNSMGYLEKTNRQMWVVEDMVFPGVIKKITSGFSWGKINNMELKFPWGDKKIMKIPLPSKVWFFLSFKIS